MIYLDNCATTRPDKSVVELMASIMYEEYGNPSSLHELGINAHKHLEIARNRVACLIGAKPEQIIFTSVATESNNMAMVNYVNKLKTRGNKIITSNQEHASIAKYLNHLTGCGFNVVYIPADSKGRIDLNLFESELDENTILVCLMHVNNNLGTITNLKKACDLVRKKTKWAKIHADCVQSFGKIPIDVKNLEVDSLSFSAHKIYGPKGVGGLYIKSPETFSTFIFGGGQEKNLRSGTENVPGIAGLGLACELRSKYLYDDLDYINGLRQYLVEKLKSEIDNVIVNTPLEESSPYILNISIRNCLGEVILNELSRKKIYISTGSACSSNGQKLNKSTSSLGLAPEFANGTVRICFSRDNKKEELDIFVGELKQVVDLIRRVVK